MEFFFFIAPSCGTFFVFAEVPPDGELKRYVPTRVLVIHKLVDVVYNGLEYPLELSRIFSETEGTRAHISEAEGEALMNFDRFERRPRLEQLEGLRFVTTWAVGFQRTAAAATPEWGQSAEASAVPVEHP